MAIYLVRHGETSLNQEKKFYGSLDIELNEVGRCQSEKVADKLKHLSFEAVYISGLKRTKQTAELIAPKNTHQIIPELNEKSFGVWEGLSADEIEAKYPEEWQAWLEEPFEKTPPEAETFSSFKQRVLAGMKRIEKDFDEKNQTNLLIIGHLGVLRVLDQYFNREIIDFWSIDYKQGTYTVYEFKNQHYHLVERCR